MWEELENLKRQFPLLEYLRRHNWTPRQIGSRQEFVGLCPLHTERRPSFYVNAVRNLFYCHGCGHGGDLIRFAQFYFDLSFRQTVAHLKEELGLVPAAESELLDRAAAFYLLQLHRYGEAIEYLYQRGLRDPDLIQRLSISYAPGRNLRRHLTDLGYPLLALVEAGLVSREGRDAFCRRVAFPCCEQGRTLNLYGRSIGIAPPHRFLPRPKGGWFAWESVRGFPRVILVEGLFDLAVLWQAGFLNTTCGVGTHLSPAQFAQLCDRGEREVLLVFDADANQASQQAARRLAQRLAAAGLIVRIANLPDGHDPNSYFAAGASAADFTSCLEHAQLLHP
jgi:DNA primase